MGILQPALSSGRTRGIAAAGHLVCGTGDRKQGTDRKGQASLEYLLLSVIGIGLVSFSLLSLSGIKSAMDRNMQITAFRDSSVTLHEAILETCSLGSGNERTVALSAPLALESEEGAHGWVVGYSAGNLSRADISPCEVEPARAEGEALVKNEDGKVRID